MATNWLYDRDCMKPGERPPQRGIEKRISPLSETRAKLIVKGTIKPQNLAEFEAAKEFLAGLGTKNSRPREIGMARVSTLRPLKRYERMPVVNGWLRVSENLCLARLTVPVIVLPPKNSSEIAMDIKMDLVVEFEPGKKLPKGIHEKSLYAQTVDGKHQVRMVGYGVGNLSIDVERIFNGEQPDRKHFPAIVIPWKVFEGSEPTKKY